MYAHSEPMRDHVFTENQFESYTILGNFHRFIQILENKVLYQASGIILTPFNFRIWL